MFRNLLANLPPVVKNLLIINGLFFLATLVLQGQGIDLGHILGLHYIDSPAFKPFQIATHFFMHAGFMHIFFNMFALVIFGSHLERYWGAKRFVIFYFVTALGAALLHNFVQGLEVYQVTDTWFPVSNGIVSMNIDGSMAYPSSMASGDAQTVFDVIRMPAVGASGAIYGLIIAFAMLFPNTQFMLLFPPIPIKAKWLAVGLGAIALFSGIQDNAGDSVAHFAHLGGMLFGFIMIKIWQRDRNQFY